MSSRSCEKSVFPISAPMGGIRMSFTSDDTILPNAPPMITPTAMSITLPLRANSLNSLKNAISFKGLMFLINSKNSCFFRKSNKTYDLPHPVFGFIKSVPTGLRVRLFLYLCNSNPNTRHDSCRRHRHRPGLHSRPVRRRMGFGPPRRQRRLLHRQPTKRMETTTKAALQIPEDSLLSRAWNYRLVRRLK